MAIYQSLQALSWQGISPKLLLDSEPEASVATPQGLSVK